MDFVDLSGNYQKRENISSPLEEQRNLKPLVLTVENDEEICTMLKVWLEIWKFRVENAKNSEQAATIAEEINPDVVLLDIASAKRDKFSAIRRMRNNPHLENVPIILVSGYIHFNSFSLTDSGEEFHILPMNFRSLKNALNEYRSKNNFFKEDLKV